ncbi:MAG: DUF6391 domain-containing protein [Anaerolineae bacterium]|jgi:hypothetical protein
MSEGLLSALRSLPLISQVRRNHALEHATMQILADQQSTRGLVGRSSFMGFFVYGDVDTDDLLEAAQQGLHRLRAGHRTLAIHPHCGSNYAVAGTIAGMGAFLALGGLSRDRNERLLDRLARLPLACAIGTLGVILSRPLGAAVQAHVTTEADVGDLRVTGVRRSEHAGTTIHFVQTAD